MSLFMPPPSLGMERNFNIIYNSTWTTYLIIPGFAGSTNSVTTTSMRVFNIVILILAHPTRARALEMVVELTGRKRQTGASQRVTVGSEVTCGSSDVCNGPLLPNTQYTIQYTLFRKATYSFPNTFTTASADGLLLQESGL